MRIRVELASEKLPPAWACDYFTASIRRYLNNETKTLGEAFSIAEIKHHAKEHDWSMAGNVWMDVCKLVDSGIPLRGNRETKGAFEVVASSYRKRMFDCSPAKIRDMYNQQRLANIQFAKNLMAGKSRAQIEEMLRQMKAALDETEE